MPLINAQGRILGRVNVIDALVLLIVGAIILAGVSLAVRSPADSPGPEVATTTAVIDLGSQPSYIARQITPGDITSTDNGSELVINDTFFAPSDGPPHAYAVVELTGPINDGTIYYAGAPPRLGRTIDIETNRYQASGTVIAVNGPLDTQSTPILLATTVSSETAALIEPGDTYSLAGHDVATIESLREFPAAQQGNRRLLVGLTLKAVNLGNGFRFGASPVRRGTSISFQTGDYRFSGTIRQVGATELGGRQETRTVTLELKDVSPSLANSIEPGMTERVRGETLATLNDVEVTPAKIVLTSQDGQVFLRDHPVRKDVRITASIQVRNTATGLYFHGRPIGQGSKITLDLGTVTIQPKITGI